MIRFKHRGSFDKTEKFLKKNLKLDESAKRILVKYAERGLVALKTATPVDTGKTANSWYYEIESQNGTAKIVWKNSNIVNGIPIAIILQYGHETGTGGYVQGLDYINPALKSVFESISEELWSEVIRN